MRKYLVLLLLTVFSTLYSHTNYILTRLEVVENSTILPLMSQNYTQEIKQITDLKITRALKPLTNTILENINIFSADFFDDGTLKTNGIAVNTLTLDKLEVSIISNLESSLIPGELLVFLEMKVWIRDAYRQRILPLMYLFVNVFSWQKQTDLLHPRNIHASIELSPIMGTVNGGDRIKWGFRSFLSFLYQKQDIFSSSLYYEFKFASFYQSYNDGIFFPTVLYMGSQKRLSKSLYAGIFLRNTISYSKETNNSSLNHYYEALAGGLVLKFDNMVYDKRAGLGRGMEAQIYGGYIPILYSRYDRDTDPLAFMGFNIQYRGFTGPKFFITPVFRFYYENRNFSLAERLISSSTGVYFNLENVKVFDNRLSITPSGRNTDIRYFLPYEMGYYAAIDFGYYLSDSLIMTLFAGMGEGSNLPAQFTFDNMYFAGMQIIIVPLTLVLAGVYQPSTMTELDFHFDFNYSLSF